MIEIKFNGSAVPAIPKWIRHGLYYVGILLGIISIPVIVNIFGMAAIGALVYFGILAYSIVGWFLYGYLSDVKGKSDRELDTYGNSVLIASGVSILITFGIAIAYIAEVLK